MEVTKWLKPSVARERQREVLSESRMREICMSGCVSSEGWHVQQEKGLPGQKSEPRSLDSRVAGNQDPEAYRQRLPWGRRRVTGP